MFKISLHKLMLHHKMQDKLYNFSFNQINNREAYFDNFLSYTFKIHRRRELEYLTMENYFDWQ